MAAAKYDLYKEYQSGEGCCFKTYFRTFGANYEVGIMYDEKTIFFGNFINKTEAMAWYKEMAKEMTSFAKNYEYMPNMKMAWYMGFARNYFYNGYYKFLDNAFTKYGKEYKKAYVSDIKTYKKYNYAYAM